MSLLHGLCALRPRSVALVSAHTLSICERDHCMVHTWNSASGMLGGGRVLEGQGHAPLQERSSPKRSVQVGVCRA